MSPDISMDPRLERRIAEKKAALDLQRPLSAPIVAKLYDDLRVRLTYHSNAIEGNTLDLSETQLVIEHGVTIGGHTMREHLEAVQHAAAYTLLLDLARAGAPLDEAAIGQLHALIMRDLVDTPGHYRRGAVYISGSEHRPPHHSQVPQLMRDLVEWIANDGLAYAPVVRAALTHEMFLAIHPYLDGNGRTARLLLNLQLMRDGYPAALLLAGWRPRYIRALEQAHHGQYTPLVNLIGRAVEAGLDMFLEACAAVPEQLQRPLREVADTCAIDAGYLGWLLREGRIAGQKRRGRWYTSEAAVRRYRHMVATHRTCPKCGFQQNRPSAKFCGECGADFTGSTPAQTAKAQTQKGGGCAGHVVTITVAIIGVTSFTDTDLCHQHYVGGPLT